MGTYEDPSTWRLQTEGGIPYRLVSREGAYTSKDASASEVFLIRASDLDAFAAEVFPSPRIVGSTLVYPPFRRLPGTNVPAANISWSTHIEGLPVDPYGQDPSASEGTYHPILQVTVEYNTTDPESKKEQKKNGKDSNPEDPDTFLTITSNTSGEFLHSMAPRGEWNEQDGEFEEEIVDEDDPNSQSPRNVMVPMIVTVPETEWTVRWEYVFTDMFRQRLQWKLRKLLGKVNAEVMPVFNFALPGTILFVGYDVEEDYAWREIDGQVETITHLTMKFHEKLVTQDLAKPGPIFKKAVHGHNSFWRPEKGGWSVLILNKDTGRKAYEEDDLNECFRFMDDPITDGIDAAIYMQKDVLNTL